MREETFADWVEARSPALLRFAYLATGSQAAAEEAVQAGLARVFERWSWVRRTQDPDAYVRRVITNAHISAWRRSGRREVPVAEPHSADPGPDPAARSARADLVWRVCATLPPRQRAAVVLRFYEDLDYPEIAAILEVTESTVRSAVHRALATLRSQLQQEADDG